MASAEYLGARSERRAQGRLRNSFELTQRQWEAIEPLLPGKPGDPGRTGTNNRNFVNGVLWVLGHRMRWCHLPVKYGLYKSVHKRFKRWEEKGIWRKVFARLNMDLDTGLPMLQVRTRSARSGTKALDSVFDLGW